MTLMPVSKISTVVVRLSNAGGSRWMGHFSPCGTGPASSIS